MPGRTTNFKTYEAQSRLLAAVVAAHPELKLNFKAIAENFGSTTTASAIEHRLRPIKELARNLRAAKACGEDPATVDNITGGNKEELAKHFGESTPDGLSFQFRDIKKGAKGIQEAVRNGADPIEGYHAALGGSPATPRGGGGGGGGRGGTGSGRRGGGGGGRAKATPGTRSGGSSGVATRKRGRKNYKEPEDSEGSDGGDVDWSGKDEDEEETPSKRPRYGGKAVAATGNGGAGAGSVVSTPVIMHSPPTESDYSTVATPSGTGTGFANLASSTNATSFATDPNNNNTNAVTNSGTAPAASFTGHALFAPPAQAHAQAQAPQTQPSQFDPYIKQELQEYFPHEDLGFGDAVGGGCGGGGGGGGAGVYGEFDFDDQDNGEV